MSPLSPDRPRRTFSNRLLAILAAVVIVCVAGSLLLRKPWSPASTVEPVAEHTNAVMKTATVPTPPGVAPYRATLMQQYWVFSPAGIEYHHHGELDVLKDNPGGLESVTVPVWPGSRLEHVSISRTIATPQFRESWGVNSQIVGVFLHPSTLLKKGQVLSYDINWGQDRVPYLHDEQGGNHRLLSLSFTRFRDNPTTLYAFAIPADCTGISTFDTLPTRRARIGDWLLFLYDTTKLPRATIHIAFNYGPMPTSAPPSAKTVYHMNPTE